MAEVMEVIGKLINAVSVFVVFSILCKNSEYLLALPKSDKHRTLLAWNVLVLFILVMSLLIKLIMT